MLWQGCTMRDAPDFPLVSVLVASYNYEPYLGMAIQSVLDQSCPHFELLIIDDGSTDGSVALAESYAAKDVRISVVRQPDGKNHGLPATLALGIALARGKYIAFLESAALWEPECLAQRLGALEDSNAGVVFNAVEPLYMPGADPHWFESYMPRILHEHTARVAAQGDSACTPYSLRTAFLIENKIPTFSCAMVSAALLKNCSFNAPVPRWLDWWLWIQLAQKTQFVFIQKPLTIWRMHNKSFNYKLTLSRHLIDASFIWNGFRKYLYKDFLRSGETKAALFLCCPFWVRLVARIWMRILYAMKKKINYQQPREHFKTR